MEQKNPSWLPIVIVAAFSACGGFLAGSVLGIRERGTLKAKNAALAKSESVNGETLSASRNDLDDLTSQLDQAIDNVEHWRSECERLQSIVDNRTEAAARIHPPLIMEFDPFEAENRILELECEVASLKDLLRADAVTALDGPPPNHPSTRIAQEIAADPLTAKPQCSALTKKGLRCSRTARSAGKCWQHGG